MRSKALVVAIAAVCLPVPVLSAPVLAAPVLAEDTPPESAGGRYTFNKVADGFLRLDAQTGEVALCSQRTVGWACQAAPEDRAALEDEITRLHSENATLKRELLSRGLPLPPGVMPGPQASHDNDITIHLPSNAELDRAIAYLGQMWQRFVDAVARVQKDMLNRT